MQQVCGTTLWREVSDVQGELITTIINLPNDSYETPRCATRAKRVGWSVYLGRGIQSFHDIVWNNTSSSTGQSYAPPTASQVTASVSSQASPAQTTLTHGLAQPNSPSPTNASQTPHPQAASVQQTASRRTWILLGIQGEKRTMEPAEIQVDEWTTDYHFFKALRLCYRRHRGKLRLWFSIWRLHYCEVVKVMSSEL